MLVLSDTTKYFDFRQIDGSFVLASDQKVHKVPASDSEALRSGLLSFLEKNRARKFFGFLQEFDAKDVKTHLGFNVDVDSMDKIYEYFGLCAETKDFIGHALALYTEDSYINKPARPTIERIRLYFESLARFGKSPYIYPQYGLGELPQGFARLSAIHGGTYMMDRKFEGIEYDADGKFVGVKADGATVKAKFVVCDPTYVPDKVRKVGQVARSINIVKGFIPNTKDADSLQVVIPQSTVGRKNDIYISMLSATQAACPAPFRIATVATLVETKDPAAELKIGARFLPEILVSVPIVKDVFEPLADGIADRVFISKSYDASSHFESSSADIADLWLRITGTPLDFTKKPAALEEAGAASSSNQ